MQNKLLTCYDKVMLRKRSLVETVFDYMKNKFNLEYTWHRSPSNFPARILAKVLAYQFMKNKPKITPNFAQLQRH